MFAVVRTGGKQYRVAPGDKIVVEKLDGNAGDKVTLGDVLLAGDGGELKPTNGLTVAAEIVAQAKGDKVTVFKKRRRHNYRRKKGHRQQHTILKIVAIGDHKHVPSKVEGAPAKPKTESAPKAAPETAGKTAPAAPAKNPKPGKLSPKDAKAAEEGKKEKVEEAAPANVEAQPTENPAPGNQTLANPPLKGDIEITPKDGASAKKAGAKAEASASGGKPAKAASTKNAAPAKGGAKKAPKAK